MSKKTTEICEEPIEKKFIENSLKEDNPPVFSRPPNQEQDDQFFKLLQKTHHPLKLVRVKEGSFIKYKVEGTDKVVFTDRTRY